MMEMTMQFFFYTKVVEAAREIDGCGYSEQIEPWMLNGLRAALDAAKEGKG
jgi:hypothetical protein